MTKEKLNIFDVKKGTNKALTISLAAYLFFAALVEVGDFLGITQDSSGTIVYGLSKLTQSGVGKVLLMIASTGFLVFIWEWFRRSLKAVNSKIWYIILALITLMICDVPFSLVSDSANVMDQIQHPSRFSDFSERFLNASSGIQSVLQIVLSIILMIKYKGKIRAFGIANLVCIFVSGMGLAQFYSYLVEHSVNFMDRGLAFLFVAFRYLVGVIPVIFLRLTMSFRGIKAADSSNDLN